MKRYIAAIAGGIALLAIGAALVWPYKIAYTFTLPPPGGSKPGAAAFLTNLYAHYDGKDQDFSPLGDHASQWFDPELSSLIKADSAGGEVGALDGDPICDCQDYGRLSAQVTVVTADDKHARASVVVMETDPHFDAEGRKPRTFTYDLVDIDGRWYIHDVGSSTIPSLRQLLQQARHAESASV